MGLFSSGAVKNLKKQAEDVGGLVAMQALGELPPGAADEVIRGDLYGAPLREAFQEAAREVGAEKALKKAMGCAGSWAQAKADIRNVPSYEIRKKAEDAVKQILAPQQVS